MNFKTAKGMIAHIVKHGKENNAYIVPHNVDHNEIIELQCIYSNKTWKITKSDFKKTASETEMMMIKHRKLLDYFCRAASCRMHHDFENDLKYYMKYVEWYDSLSESKKRYMRVVEKFSSLVT